MPDNGKRILSKKNTDKEHTRSGEFVFEASVPRLPATAVLGSTVCVGSPEEPADSE